MEEKDLRDGSLYEYVYRYKARRSSVRFYCILLLLVAAALCFRMYWTSTFGGVYVDGDSMMMTLLDGDELIMKYGSDAKRGDVIVLDVRSYGFDETQFLIKRLIAVEGDEIYCENSTVYIKYAGTDEFTELYDPHAYYAGNDHLNFASPDDPYVVGKGEIFFLGDNRTRSKDSRYKEGLSHLTDSLYKVEDIYGVVPEWAVRHKGLLKYLPGMRESYS